MNVLVLPLQFGEPQFRMVPPYWSVAIEIQMYLLLFLFIARHERLALLALAAGAFYHLACLSDDAGFGARYFTAPAAMLSFSIGALIYFGAKRGLLNVSPATTAWAFAAWTVNLSAGQIRRNPTPKFEPNIDPIKYRPKLKCCFPLERATYL